MAADDEPSNVYKIKKDKEKKTKEKKTKEKKIKKINKKVE